MSVGKDVLRSVLNDVFLLINAPGMAMQFTNQILEMGKLLSSFVLFTLLHSFWPKLHRVLAIQSAIGLRHMKFWPF